MDSGMLPDKERWLVLHLSLGEGVVSALAALSGQPLSGANFDMVLDIWCNSGNWDVKTKIPEQCVSSDIPLPPYFNEWINLKDIYLNHYKQRVSKI